MPRCPNPAREEQSSLESTPLDSTWIKRLTPRKTKARRVSQKKKQIHMSLAIRDPREASISRRQPVQEHRLHSIAPNANLLIQSQGFINSPSTTPGFPDGTTSDIVEPQSSVGLLSPDGTPGLSTMALQQLGNMRPEYHHTSQIPVQQTQFFDVSGQSWNLGVVESMQMGASPMLNFGDINEAGHPQNDLHPIPPQSIPQRIFGSGSGAINIMTLQGPPLALPVSFDSTIIYNFISRRVAVEAGAEIVPLLPCHKKQIQTPEGYFAAQELACGIYIESNWSEFRIPRTSVQFIVHDPVWTGTQVFLGESVVDQIRTMRLHSTNGYDAPHFTEH